MNHQELMQELRKEDSLVGHAARLTFDEDILAFMRAILDMAHNDFMRKVFGEELCLQLNLLFKHEHQSTQTKTLAIGNSSMRGLNIDFAILDEVTESLSYSESDALFLQTGFLRMDPENNPDLVKEIGDIPNSCGHYWDTMADFLEVLPYSVYSFPLIAVRIARWNIQLRDGDYFIGGTVEQYQQIIDDSRLNGYPIKMIGCTGILFRGGKLILNPSAISASSRQCCFEVFLQLTKNTCHANS